MTSENDANNSMCSSQKTKRKPRKPITIKDLEIIRNLMLEGDSARKIARSLKFSHQTIYSAIKKIEQCEADGRPLTTLILKPGPSPISLSDTMIKISEAVQNEPLTTQKGICCFLGQHDILISQSAVSRNLKRLEITRKRV